MAFAFSAGWRQYPLDETLAINELCVLTQEVTTTLARAKV
jgi:hypothetical protein